VLKHRIALIGAGRIGKIHAANVAAHPLLELALIVDSSADAARSLARHYGINVGTLDDVLLDTAIAGVIVASSTETHLDYSLRAAEAGKSVFCEKPLDLDLAHARDRALRLDKVRAKIFLAFNRRFDPNFQRLKSKLAENIVGSLETLHIISHDPSPPPMSYIPVSGGLFKDMAIHDFDMARWLLGEEPTEVFAVGGALVDPEIGKLGDIDTAKTILRTASSKLCVISNSRRSGYGYDQRIEAFCSAGALRADNVVESTVVTWAKGGAMADAFQNFFLERYAEAYRREMAHFADILSGRAEPLIDHRDGIAALALAEAATRSVREGRSIRVC
jgi:myo-inositol 2-dehydrogenase/D-chiro-inositol 1-dehydrogenase